MRLEGAQRREALRILERIRVLAERLAELGCQKEGTDLNWIGLEIWLSARYGEEECGVEHSFEERQVMDFVNMKLGLGGDNLDE